MVNIDRAKSKVSINLKVSLTEVKISMLVEY